MDISVNASLLSLSDEILLIIISSLRPEDKIALTQVCCRFDRIILDKRLCGNFELSPKQDNSCLKSVGAYLRKRRQLISTFNINSCDWIPMQRIKLMTKGLTNLHSLHVMNISMPISLLSEILGGCKQIRKLSWSWRGDGYCNKMLWSDVSSECKCSLSSLTHLYICVPDPWAHSVQEFLLVYCNGLTHLILQLDTALGQVPRIESLDEESLHIPLKLKSVVAYHVNYGSFVGPHTTYISEIKLEALMRRLWDNSGGLENKWECFWLNTSSRMHWLHPLESSRPFLSFLSNLKSAILYPDESLKNIINFSLSVKDLYVVIQGGIVPLVHVLAPKVERLTFGVASIFDLKNQISSSIYGLKHLVELNLYAIHLCESPEYIKDLWICMKKFDSLRKLAVAPCAMPRYLTTKSNSWNEENFNISCSLNDTEINKDLYEIMKLDHLEVFELGEEKFVEHVCHSGRWIPYISVISIWKSLTCLTFNTIVTLRTMAQFKMVAKSCVNLSDLRFQQIGPVGHCGYVKDVANTLPLCHNLKHFCMEQSHIADFLIDLLLGLSKCIQLETVSISNSHNIEKSCLKGKHKIEEIILNLIRCCPLLNFLRVSVPQVSKKRCKKIQNLVASKLTTSTRTNIIMEFCEMVSVIEDQYHGFPPDASRLEYMSWDSKVARIPLVI